MSGLVLLIPIALFLGLAGLAAFFWAMRDGQFEELDGATLVHESIDQAPVQGQFGVPLSEVRAAWSATLPAALDG